MGGAPLVTLLTDFGIRDTYVAEMKAAMLAVEPTIHFVDITHEVTPGDVAGARYFLERIWWRFPEKTVHLVVVDPGVGTERRAIAISHAGHGFVAPDNGVLGAVLDGADAVELTIPEDASPTFHGRDVFAPAAARLAAGTPLTALGTPCVDVVRPVVSRVRHDDDVVIGHVLHVDQFGNLVTDLPVPDRTDIVLHVGGRDVTPIRRTFGDVAFGELVAYVGSAGTIEVAVRDGSAARMLGLGRGAEVRVMPREP
ncbi:MAG TPA: SAM-dependent chlorinase/fluorinase [Gemmatimonadales bacterium]|nr:SAM-dependent chlorinase/fluorinase [Gemmatimonadales bacterium]